MFACYHSFGATLRWLFCSILCCFCVELGMRRPTVVHVCRCLVVSSLVYTAHTREVARSSILQVLDGRKLGNPILYAVCLHHCIDPCEFTIDPSARSGDQTNQASLSGHSDAAARPVGFTGSKVLIQCSTRLITNQRYMFERQLIGIRIVFGTRRRCTEANNVKVP